MRRELPESLIENVRVKDVIAARFGCKRSYVLITSQGKIKVPGRGTIVNNVDDFWILLFGSAAHPRDIKFDVSGLYCMNCQSWGEAYPKWVGEIRRECSDPRNSINGTQHISKPFMTCDHFKPIPGQVAGTKRKKKGKKLSDGKARTAKNPTKNIKK